MTKTVTGKTGDWEGTFTVTANDDGTVTVSVSTLVPGVTGGAKATVTVSASDFTAVTT